MCSREVLRCAVTLSDKKQLARKKFQLIVLWQCCTVSCFRRTKICSVGNLTPTGHSILKRCDCVTVWEWRHRGWSFSEKVSKSWPLVWLTCTQTETFGETCQLQFLLPDMSMQLAHRTTFKWMQLLSSVVCHWHVGSKIKIWSGAVTDEF